MSPLQHGVGLSASSMQHSTPSRPWPIQWGKRGRSGGTYGQLCGAKGGDIIQPRSVLHSCTPSTAVSPFYRESWGMHKLLEVYKHDATGTVSLRYRGLPGSQSHYGGTGPLCRWLWPTQGQTLTPMEGCRGNTMMIILWSFLSLAQLFPHRARF